MLVLNPDNVWGIAFSASPPHQAPDCSDSLQKENSKMFSKISVAKATPKSSRHTKTNLNPGGACDQAAL